MDESDFYETKCSICGLKKECSSKLVEPWAYEGIHTIYDFCPTCETHVKETIEKLILK